MAARNCTPKKRAADALYRAKNRSAIRSKDKERREAGRPNQPAYNRAYRLRLDPERKAADRSVRHAKQRDCNLVTIKKWKGENQKIVNSYEAKRRAAKLNRTPSWADLVAIKEFYRNCPDGHHVDHIIPLQGRHVSGLHVLDNLQYLVGEENIRKGNRYVVA